LVLIPIQTHAHAPPGSTRDQLLREAIRVIRTKQILKEVPSNRDISLEPDALFRWMKERVGERELGHSPGDRELFHKLYQTGQDMDLLEYALLTLQQDRITGGVVIHPGITARFIEMCDRHHYRSILFITDRHKNKNCYKTKKPLYTKGFRR
jgi:hypothetical protein